LRGGGPNLYEYAAGKPIKLVDPSGTGPPYSSFAKPSEKAAAEQFARGGGAATYTFADDPLTGQAPVREGAVSPPVKAEAAAEPASSVFEGPSIGPVSEADLRAERNEKLVWWDVPPTEFTPDESAAIGIEYDVAYWFKHSIYAPVKDWVKDEPQVYLDSDHNVRKSSVRRDHMDAAIAIAELVVLVLPTPKASTGGGLLAKLMGEGAPPAATEASRLFPGGVDDVITSASRPSRAGSTTSRALQALQKKISNPSKAANFGGLKANEATANSIIREAFGAPYPVFRTSTNRAGQEVIDVLNPWTGRGVRLMKESGAFDTFVNF